MAEDRDEQLVEECLKGQGGRRSDGHDAVVLAGALCPAIAPGEEKPHTGRCPQYAYHPRISHLEHGEVGREWLTASLQVTFDACSSISLSGGVAILLSTPNYCVSRWFFDRANRPFPLSENPQLRCVQSVSHLVKVFTALGSSSTAIRLAQSVASLEIE